MPRVSRKRLSSRVVRPRLAVEECRCAGQQHEDGRAEMRDPARHEQRRLGHVARVEPAGREEITYVIERHQHHDETAHQVDRIDARVRIRVRSRPVTICLTIRRVIARCLEAGIHGWSLRRRYTVNRLVEVSTCRRAQSAGARLCQALPLACEFDGDLQVVDAVGIARRQVPCPHVHLDRRHQQCRRRQRRVARGALLHERVLVDAVTHMRVLLALLADRGLPGIAIAARRLVVVADEDARILGQRQQRA